MLVHLFSPLFSYSPFSCFMKEKWASFILPQILVRCPGVKGMTEKGTVQEIRLTVNKGNDSNEQVKIIFGFQFLAFNIIKRRYNRVISLLIKMLFDGRYSVISEGLPRIEGHCLTKCFHHLTVINVIYVSPYLWLLRVIDAELFPSLKSNP